VQAVLAAKLEDAASVAANACLVEPDGGNPTEDEKFVCEEAYRRVRALITPDMAQALAARDERIRREERERAAGYISRAVDAVTSGSFDQSDPRVDALCEYADAIHAEGEGK